MPRSAVETPLTESPSPALNDLLKRGRAHGRLSLDEVRGAFETAGISPAQGRSILRELSEAGISLAGESDAVRKMAAAADHAGGETAQDTSAAPGARKRAARRGAARSAAKSTGRVTRPGGQADAAVDEGFEVTEVEAEETSADLDDQSTTMGDSVHTYLKAIGRRQLLTAEQEVDLAKRIEAGLYAEHKLESEDLSPAVRADLEWVAADGRRAKAHMLEANLRLVVSVAKKYSDRGLSLLDVVQEGNLGLIRAVEKFDYSKGYKFSTYAMWWIRQAIQRGFADSARTIRLPVHVLEMLSKLSRVERDMHQRLGREPTPEELAAELDKSPEQVRELLRTSRQPISLDSTIGEDGETRIGDLIEDTDSPEASELVDRQLMADQLRRTLDILSPREAKIMAMRFGLYDGTPRTLDEIGKALGLTRERIRQLEKESLSKLRHPSNARPLLDFAV
ncbi:RNA polymerase sigma factor [Actinomadura citrea]|jgi:RNA polymerase primary sigma factor|uniref:RNA polymerase sigma factor n=1 Tax=Actinomadura citrea TaxID=46158 RepID=A0A7Y9GCB8_9ACTN|nr:RNA polymerase sigma factor [Actinomadura citrea]NYE13892.1 RNA polymerase primary sigma factor [Actinomadura citrea]GGT98374.1 RNA polymerase sigma factor SigA [Actinomadura citrea]